MTSLCSASPVIGTLSIEFVQMAGFSRSCFRPASIQLNAAALSDIADADAAYFGFTNPGEVTVTLGDMTQATPQQTITFRVTIN